MSRTEHNQTMSRQDFNSGQSMSAFAFEQNESKPVMDRCNLFYHE